MPRLSSAVTFYRVLVTSTLVVALLASSAPLTAAATPPVASPPDVQFVVGHALGTVTVPVRVSWPDATPADAPISRYKLQGRTDEGPWQSISLSSATARSATVRLRPGTLNQFRVRAIDASGARSAWATAQPLWLAVVQENQPEIDYTGSWTAHEPSSAYGGSLVAATQSGATATFEFTATRVAWVAVRAPDRGRAEVAVNGGAPAMVDLRSSSRQPRRIVFAGGWSSAVPRSLEVAVEGTSTRPRVDVDALLTLGPAPTSVVVGAGDIATCGGSGDQATAEVVKGVEGTVFTTGDNAYPNGTTDDFANCYEPSWGAFRERTRPSPGNHDYAGTVTAAAYFGYFGEQAGEIGKGYYAYDSGTWRMYALNSNCSNVGGCGTASAQYAWLLNDLAANPRRCVAAYWHHPRFSSGYHGASTRMAELLTLLYDNGADVVLAGHDHSYERLAPMTPSGVADPVRGIRHFIVGTGGAGLYAPGASVAPNSELHETETHGVLKLTLGWSQYSWQFLPAGSGTFTDSGTGACH